MGASGSGKTTLVNILSTIDEATGGQILLNQKIYFFYQKRKSKSKKEEIGFIFQNYNLIESLTIKNNILFSPRLNKVDQKNTIRKIK